MCGRYALQTDPKVLVAQLSLDQVALEDGRVGTLNGELADGASVSPEALRASYNVAPTQLVPAVIDMDAQRTLALFSWGLVPGWAKDPAVGTRMINARVETIEEKPSYRSAVAKRRCLVPADGWYEWQKAGAAKVPHYLTTADSSLLTFAGIYEKWTAPDGYVLWSVSVITTAAQEHIAGIHDRMPLLVQPHLRDAWLESGPVPIDEFVAAAEVPGQITSWPVGSSVGNVRNNGPELISPLGE
jgi:putative SOS response-associated peptidase YedK